MGLDRVGVRRGAGLSPAWWNAVAGRAFAGAGPAIAEAGGGTGPDRQALQTLILRSVIVVFMALQVADLALHHTLEDTYDRVLIKLGGTLLLTYCAMVIFNLAAQWLDQKFGRSKTIDGTVVLMASYHSRMATLMLVIVTCPFYEGHP